MGYYIVPMTWMRDDEKGSQYAVRLAGTRLAEVEDSDDRELQIFTVRANAFSFIAFLNGNARIELDDLMAADLGGYGYAPRKL